MTQPKLAKPVIKNCTEKVRRGAQVQTCGTLLKTGRCQQRDEHLLPFLTGFCDSGWHEGHKVDKPTCKFWVTCPCECHAQLSIMMEMTGQERTLVDNSTFRPKDTFVRVSLTEAVQTSLAANPKVSIAPSPAPGIVPQVVTKEFAPTPSGRAGRGQLESWVRQVTDEWAVEGGPNCTPSFVSERIARRHGISPPSSGAVDAVFKRWTKIGFAVIETKPTRFARYTEDGVNLGLEVLKARAAR